MSNDLTVSPTVMINRIVAREATPPGAELARVAALRLRLEHAETEQQVRVAQFDPEAVTEPVTTGAEVDRLV
ncbi:hypothetical protein [Devosia beringensis]|uniref:hypothetical protein n=1 Tax=Devosia beringensis TaxID=2657486 RepID=UPI00186B5A57|nr:hypothetical protein [Devosia beringensis]